MRSKVKGSLPFREGLGVGFKSYAAPMMGRAYINVGATSRSGYIPSMWRGVGWRSSFGTFLQRKVVKRLSSRRKKEDPALRLPLIKGL